MSTENPYRATSEAAPTERTVTDREAALRGLSGLALGPVIFLFVALAALPIFVWSGLEELIRYVSFRAVQIGHMRLGVDNTRTYDSPTSRRFKRVVSFAEHTWGRNEESAMDLVMFVICTGGVLHLILLTLLPFILHHHG